MSELPQLDGQIRVLIVEEDMMAVRAVLVRCTEAGMDTRYAPPGAAAVEAVCIVRPHLILLGIAESEDASLRLAALIGTKSAAPLLVLTEPRTDVLRWQGISPNSPHFIDKKASAQEILEHITALIRETYHESQLMVADTPSDNTATRLPAGWGKCQSCGYIGPRAKFLDANPLARHTLICPVCKRFDDLVFSVS